MEIVSIIKDKKLGDITAIYHDADTMTHSNIQGVHAFCFYNDKMIVVYNQDRDTWTPPGGAAEQGETYEDATVREVLEETNMRVLYQELIGYQDIFEGDIIKTQTRSFCIVEPVGDFVADPDGDVIKIEFIDPADYKNYFDWGEKGDRIVQRALEKYERYKKDR